MTQYCTQGQNVSLKITTPGGSSTTGFATAPVDAELNASDSTGNVCWRFQQIIDGAINLEYFGCGKAASYQLSGEISGYDVPAFNLYIDQVLQESITYTYGQGTDVDGRNWSTTLATVQSVSRSTSNSIGDCSCLVGGQCKLTVTDVNSGNLLVKTIYPYACNLITLDGACNGCNSNQLQCRCPSYPGYCCIDCADIENKIDNMTQQVKELATYYG